MMMHEIPVICQLEALVHRAWLRTRLMAGLRSSSVVEKHHAAVHQRMLHGWRSTCALLQLRMPNA